MTDKKKTFLTETIILIMGWTHLLFLVLAITFKFGLGLYFMSAGWAMALNSFIGLFSGKGISFWADLNSMQKNILGLGTIYGFYHVVLIVLFLVAVRKFSKRLSYFFGAFSIIILVFYTYMGFNFTWT